MYTTLQKIHLSSLPYPRLRLAPYLPYCSLDLILVVKHAAQTLLLQQENEIKPFDQREVEVKQ